MTAANRTDSHSLQQFVSTRWDADIVPRLIEYIRIPCKSPHFDPQWQSNGHIEAAVTLGAALVRGAGDRRHAVRNRAASGTHAAAVLRGPGQRAGTVLLYGHLDKQPEMIGWREGLGPWMPVLEDGKLYGRGGADDGYAVFASLLALTALAQAGHCARALRRLDRDAARKAAATICRRTSKRLRERIGARRSRHRAGSGLRQLRSTVGDDFAARTRSRHVDGGSADARACIRAMRAESCRLRFASRANCSIAWKTRAAAASSAGSILLSDPGRARAAGAAGRQDPRRQHLDQVSVRRTARSRW